MSTNPPGYEQKYYAKNNHANYKKYVGNKRAMRDIVRRRAARRKMGIKVGDQREVDHIDGNPANNARSNLRVISRRLNRKLGGASKKRTDGKLG